MKTLFPTTAATILSLIIALALPAALSAADATTLTKVGDQSPVSSVRTIDGKDVNFANQVVVLNFFATWCGPCMSEMPHVQKELWEPLKAKGLVVIAVGREHSPEEVKAFQEKKGFTFMFAADPKREIFSKFATQSIPRCVVIGKDGHIKYQSIGFGESDFPNLVKAANAELAK
jgi:peroxiredoxin